MEIVMANADRYFAEDQRSVTAGGIQSAMRIFCAHYTLSGTAAGTGAQVLKLDVRREVSAAARSSAKKKQSMHDSGVNVSRT
jgi:hypothetical protein